MFVGTTLTVNAGTPAALRQVMRELGLKKSSRMGGFLFRRNGGKVEVFRRIEEGGNKSSLRLVAVLNPLSSLACRITRA